MDIETYALAKRYTDKEVAGGGAIKGKNCVITEIEEITGGHRVHFQWTLDDGTVETDTMDVMDGSDVDASEINGNIRIDDEEVTVYDDTAIQTAIENIEDELSTDSATVEGNPINFSTLSAQNAKSTILSLEPIQDLHGYDYPWVGGAGKNKFDGSFEQGNYSTIDGSKVSTNNYVRCEKFEFTSGTYTISKSPALPGNVFMWDSNDVFLGRIEFSNSSKTFETLENTSYIAISLYSQGIVPSDVEWVQIEAGSTATSYEPYENICPITGRTQVGIEGCGKNLLKNEGTTDTINGVTFTLNPDGSVLTSGTNNSGSTAVFAIAAQSSVGLRDRLQGKRIIFSGCPQGGSISTYGLLAYNFTGTGTTQEDSGNGITINFNNESANFSVGIAIRNGVNANGLVFKPMIRLATDTDATFEPYTQSNNLTIQFGQTVYGGTLDVEKGELVVDKRFKTFNGSETWLNSIPNRPSLLYTIWEPADTEVINDGIDAITSAYKVVHMKLENLSNGECLVSPLQISSYKSSVIVKDDRFTDTSTWRTYLASNNLQVCYELATPITINLTPHTINLLKGVNNISTDGDKITLTYRDGSVATLGDLTSAVDNLDSKIDESKILTDTETGTKYRLVVTDGVLGIEEVTEPNLSVSPLASIRPNVEPMSEPEETSEESTEEPLEEIPSEEISTENIEDEER